MGTSALARPLPDPVAPPPRVSARQAREAAPSQTRGWGWAAGSHTHLSWLQTEGPRSTVRGFSRLLGRLTDQPGGKGAWEEGPTPQPGELPALSSGVSVQTD